MKRNNFIINGLLTLVGLNITMVLLGVILPALISSKDLSLLEIMLSVSWIIGLMIILLGLTIFNKKLTKKVKKVDKK